MLTKWRATTSAPEQHLVFRPAGRSTYTAAKTLNCVWQEGSEDEVESLETSEDGWRDDESELFIQLISCDHVLFVCILFTYLDT